MAAALVSLLSLLIEAVGVLRLSAFDLHSGHGVGIGRRWLAPLFFPWYIFVLHAHSFMII